MWQCSKAGQYRGCCWNQTHSERAAGRPAKVRLWNIWGPVWKLWHTTLIIFKIRRRKKSQITETTITCMLLQSHKINVETEQKPIDNRIHHECCRKEALNPVIVTKCLRAMMKYYRSLTHFWCETTSRNLLDQCCGVTVTSTRSGGHYKTLLTVIKLAALNKKMCSHSVAAL